MARIFKALNPNRLKVEAYIEAEMGPKLAYEEKRAKKRPIVMFVCLLLIAASVLALLFAFFGPGVLKNILSTVKDTLNQWAEQLRFTYDEVENGDYSGEFGERILSGIGGFFLGLLRGLGALLLNLLALISPVVVIAGMLAVAGGIVYFALCVISDFGWRASTPEEIRESIIRGMDGEMHKLVSGLEGEEAALEAVSRLDDDSYIFENLVVWLDGDKNEADLIVVNPSGVTVMEVKDYSGTLLGDLSQPKIIQRKCKKKDKYEDKDADNPVQQIEGPAKKLEAFLARKGVSVAVRRCALFTNENVDIQVSDSKGLARACPLFLLNSQELLPYLHTNYHQNLDHAQIQKIVSALRTLL